VKKIVERLLIFFIGLPLVLFIVLFLPWKHHLACNLIIILLSALSALELAAMLRKKGLHFKAAEAAVLGAVAPFAMTLYVSFGLKPELVPCFFVAAASWLLVSRVFSRPEKIAAIAFSLPAGFFVLVYPSFFLSWIIWMNQLPHASLLMAIYLLMVLGNDSLAWVFGMLLGKNNRGLVPVSPNKSAAGFAGGIATSIGVGAGAAVLFPEFFQHKLITPLAAGMILGFLTGTAGVLGDLVESALKRSCGVKDSGGIIPGRGGVLDSLDSLALAAPVFYVMYRALF
jgi:phosphatidate cytidylyltransferase